MCRGGGSRFDGSLSTLCMIVYLTTLFFIRMLYVMEGEREIGKFEIVKWQSNE